LSEEHDVARPGLDPTGSVTAGPMSAAFHGRLDPHQAPESEHDAYQLFHQRSVAMGWLDDRSSAADAERVFKAPGLWAMNDAVCDTRHAPAGPFARFQVECSTPASDRPLPVQPFLRCAEETTARIGRAHLSAVELLLPLQGLTRVSRPRNALVPSMETCDWFGERGPQSRTPVKVTIDSGPGPSAAAVVQRLGIELGDLEQDVFHPHKSERDDRAGPTLRGELAEWSCDAIGWLAATIADSAAHLGVHTPLRITVARD
jgi:hypothetical protein